WRDGCMEAYAGRRAMEAEARRRHDDGEKTILFHLMEERGRDRLTAGIWDRALREGDHVAHKVIDRAYRALGAGVASAVNLLDVTVVNVALPDIQKDLGSSFSDLQWVVDAYALTLAAFLLTFGSLSDLVGRRLVFVLGLGVFSAASLLCGLSTTPLMLNLARA